MPVKTRATLRRFAVAMTYASLMDPTGDTI